MAEQRFHKNHFCFWHRIKKLRKILHNWRVGSILRDAFLLRRVMAEQRFYKNHFCFDIGLRIYAKFYTIEELVAFSEMPSASSYGWTKVSQEPLFFWHWIKNLREILHNWRVGSALRGAFCVELWLNKGAFCVELWLNKGFTRATSVLTSD